MLNNKIGSGLIIGLIAFVAVALFSVTGTFSVVSAANNTTHLACMSNTCTLVNGSGTNECSSAGASCNSSNQTHLACVNQACVSVSGAGSNLCTSSSQCTNNNQTNQTHLACINQACVSVNGSGQNQCTSSSQCSNGNQTHLACVGFSCSLVGGAGNNTCASNSDCSHLGCVYLNGSNQGTCQLVLGRGANECDLNEFCAKAVGIGTINDTNATQVQPKSLRKSPTITGHAACAGISGFFKRIFSPQSC